MRVSEGREFQAEELANTWPVVDTSRVLPQVLPFQCQIISIKLSASTSFLPESFVWALEPALPPHTRAREKRVEGKAEVHILYWLLDFVCGVRSVPTVEVGLVTFLFLDEFPFPSPCAMS